MKPQWQQNGKAQCPNMCKSTSYRGGERQKGVFRWIFMNRSGHWLRGLMVKVICLKPNHE